MNRDLIKAVILVTGCAFILGGCGPSAAETELANIKFQRQLDSIEAADAAQRKLMMDSIAGVESTIGQLERALIEGKAELAKAQDRLNRANDFQVLRTRAEREEQLRAATTSVEEIKLWIRDMEEKIAAWEDHKGKLSAELNR